MALEVGSTLHSYEILDVLGAGGMGTVYAAKDTKLDRRVAIKVLPDQTAHDDGFRTRFIREAKALAALSHPNVLAIHDFGESSGVFYAVTELLEGDTLERQLNGMPLASKTAGDWALQIARGLAAAHDKGIVHRDLKPANIFVTRAGVLKILDFGLAKVMAPLRSGERAETAFVADTQPGAILGTVAYMSPEQAHGRETDQRSDIFAFGAVLFEMLTGQAAFAGESPADTLSRILHHAPELTLADAAMPAFGRIVARCLQKDPADRFQSARDLVFALETLSGVELPVGESARRAAAAPRSIAVLPFADMSPARDQAYFCEGMAEEIINALTGVAGLRVAARSSAFRFKPGERDLRDVGKALDVSMVLEGSVRTAGNRLRVTAQLNETQTGYQVWSRRYDRSLDDVFATQDEIAADIVQSLRPDLGSSAAPLVVRHTENQEAYHLYLRGRHHWYARSKEALKKALQYFEEATQKDPEYALPYVGLADLYTVQGLYYVPPAIVKPRAKAAVEHALAINPELADAHRAQGFIELFDHWDVKAAVRCFEKSVALEPTSGLSQIWLGWATYPGREQPALSAAKHAQTLDPLNPYIHSLAGSIHDFWGHSEAGLEEAQKALDLDPHHLVALFLTGGIYTRLKHHDEALALFTRAVEITKRAAFFLSYCGWALATAGRSAEAQAIVTELEHRAAHEHVSPLHLAIIVAALGAHDRAFDLLDAAVRAEDCWLSSPRMPFFDGFRADARFAEHLRRIGHPDAGQGMLPH